MSEITGVKIIGKNEYLINELVKLSNLEFVEGDVVYDIDYDHSTITEAEAIRLCEVFINEALTGALSEEKE